MSYDVKMERIDGDEDRMETLVDVSEVRCEDTTEPYHDHKTIVVRTNHGDTQADVRYDSRYWRIASVERSDKETA